MGDCIAKRLQKALYEAFLGFIPVSTGCSGQHRKLSLGSDIMESKIIRRMIKKAIVRHRLTNWRLF